MQDYAVARRAMVDSQLRPEGVADAAVVNALANLPREKFVPAAARAKPGRTAVGRIANVSCAVDNNSRARPMPAAPGPMAEWLRRGLQIPARRFDSGSGLHLHFLRLEEKALNPAAQIDDDSAKLAIKLPFGP